MSFPLVSVIIPVYNVESYLQEALDSVINQTYKNLEIIVINDGSTDISGIICDEYASRDSRIYVIHQDNKGLSAARNVGLDVMTGDYVVFLDPDDSYYPDYVRRLIEIQIQEKADISICEILSLCEKDKDFKPKQTTDKTIRCRTLNRDDALHALINDDISVVVWNKLYLRKLWKDIRFPEGHVYEDIATTYKIINISKRITIIDQCLYIHKLRAGSIVFTYTWENICDKILACSYFDEFVEKNTPNIFTSDELKQKQQNSLKGNISLYARFKAKNRIEDEDIRQKLISQGHRIGTNGMKFHSKVAFLMLCYCPILLKFTYPVFVCTKRILYIFIRK